MRNAIGLFLLGACTITTGCAQGQFRSLITENGLSDRMASVVMSDQGAPPGNAPLPERRALRASEIVLVERQDDGYEESDEAAPEPNGDDAFVDDDQRPIEDLPAPAPVPTFRPGAGEIDIDRFTRSVTEVPLDIRNTAGAMPEDVSASAFPETPIASEPGPAPDRVEVPVGYSPWTICFRPLYFEEIRLERYGDSHGLLQPAISGAHFFGSVVALPYKMTVRPPRSCECSNGFSRPGDCPLECYGKRELRADAALVEASVVAAIALALPW